MDFDEYIESRVKLLDEQLTCLEKAVEHLDARVTWLEQKFSDLALDKMEAQDPSEYEPLLSIRVDTSYEPFGCTERRGIADSP